MTKITVPVNTPLLIGNEKKYLNQCISSRWIGSDGPFVKKFEINFLNTSIESMELHYQVVQQLWM